MLRKTLIALTAIAALGVGSTAMAMHGGGGGGHGGGFGGGWHGGGGGWQRWMACGRLPRSSLRTSRFLCTSRAFLSAPPLRVLPTSPFLRCWCWPLCHRFVLDLGAYAIRLATNLGMWRAILLKAFGSRFAAAVVARSRMITISSLSVPKSESEKAQPPANKCPLVAFRPFSRSNAREMMLGTWVKYWFALRHSLVERGRCRWSRCAEQFERANPRMLTARGELRAESRRSN